MEDYFVRMRNISLNRKMKWILHRQDIYFWNKCFYKIQEVCYN